MKRSREPEPPPPLLTDPVIVNVSIDPARLELLVRALAALLARQIIDEMAASERARAEDLLTVEQAAAVVGMGEQAFRKAVYRGTFRAVRIGRRLRFRRADLQVGAP